MCAQWTRSVDAPAECEVCGKTVKRFKSSGRPKRTCSNLCASRVRNKTAGDWRRKPCLMCGREFDATQPHQRYCSNRCIWKSAVDRLPKRRCIGCGCVFKPKRRRVSYCSRECAFHYEGARWKAVADGYLWWANAWKQCQCGDWLWRKGQCRSCARISKKERNRERYATGELYTPKTKTPRVCVMCGTEHAYPDAKCCSPICKQRLRKDEKRRRKARMRSTQTEPINDYYVFERDGWRCSRDESVPHPNAPTVDHVIPLAKGGTHTYDNVRCAHFMCNCLKSDRLVTLF